MPEKKAFVFDTNFIIENKDLRTVSENLSEQFTVYVTQVSIDERISQKCLDISKKYKSIEQFKNDYRGIATIRVTKTLEERIKEEQALTQKGYDELFGERIVPFLRDGKTFDEILNRVYQKKPPFISADGASDKGFKDSLIWYSLLGFFKKKGEDHIVFVTSDKNFRNQEADLCVEFNEITGKVIEIKDNSFYKTILKPAILEEVKESQLTPAKLPDFSMLREQIDTVVSALCGVVTVNDWGLPDWERSFTSNEKFDADYMRIIFGKLQRDIETHIFDQSVSADTIFALDDRIIKGLMGIPISSLEYAQKLYSEIGKKYPEYIEQFYATTANIFNRNYVEPFDDDDDELPF